LAQYLALDESIQRDDYLTLLAAMFSIESAERNWSWFESNVDALLDRAPTFERHQLINMNQGYCSVARADPVTALFPITVETH